MSYWEALWPMAAGFGVLILTAIYVEWRRGKTVRVVRAILKAKAEKCHGCPQHSRGGCDCPIVNEWRGRV